MRRYIDKIGNMLRNERFKDDWARHARTPRKPVEYADAQQTPRVLRFDENGRRVEEQHDTK
jgi:hypothetical protein